MIDDPGKACARVTNTIRAAMEIYILSKCVTENTGSRIWFGDIYKKTTTRKRRLLKKLEKNRDKYAENRRYNNKLKESLSDGSLSSKKWRNTVNTGPVLTY